MKLLGIFHLKEHPSMRKLGRFAAYTALAPKRALSHNRQCCNSYIKSGLRPLSLPPKFEKTQASAYAADLLQFPNITKNSVPPKRGTELYKRLIYPRYALRTASSCISISALPSLTTWPVSST